MIKKILKLLFYTKDSSKRLIPFNNNRFWSKFFIFTITSLVILVLLSIWGANFLERIINPVKYTNSNNVIVEIYPEVSQSRTDSKLQIINKYLQDNPNIDSFAVVKKDQIESLLKDWTSILYNVNDLSLPVIINVKIKKYATFSASDLQLALSQKVVDVYVESEKSLASKLTSSIDISRGLILLIPFILFLIIFGLVLFVTLALIYSHKNTIEVLSFLGASYIEVSKEFSSWVFRRSIRGCFFGLIISLLLVEIFVLFLHIGYFIIPSSTSFWLMIIVLFIIPLEASIIAFFVVKRVINWVI